MCDPFTFMFVIGGVPLTVNVIFKSNFASLISISRLSGKIEVPFFRVSTAGTMPYYFFQIPRQQISYRQHHRKTTHASQHVIKIKVGERARAPVKDNDNLVLRQTEVR